VTTAQEKKEHEKNRRETAHRGEAKPLKGVSIPDLNITHLHLKRIQALTGNRMNDNSKWFSQRRKTGPPTYAEKANRLRGYSGSCCGGPGEDKASAKLSGEREVKNP